MVFYGDELVLQFIFAPEDTTERDYEIGGYDSSVVRVSEDGVVHALADGLLHPPHWEENRRRLTEALDIIQYGCVRPGLAIAV